MPPQSRTGAAHRTVTHIGKLGDLLDEDLSQLIDSVAYHRVAGTRDGGRAMRDIVDRRADDGRAFHCKQLRNCGRRGELSREALHKNCPKRRRLQAVRETSDGFRFHTGTTAHIVEIEMDGDSSIDALILWHNTRQSVREYIRQHQNGVVLMPTRKRSGRRKYGKAASKHVGSAMRRRKRGTLKSGRSGRTVKSRKQAIAIGLSEARKKGAKVPRKGGGLKSSSGRKRSSR